MKWQQREMASPFPPYPAITRATLRQSLLDRLNSAQFWTTAELNAYITEALYVWQAHAKYWRTPVTFNTSNDANGNPKYLYDLSEEVPQLAYTVTDAALLSVIDGLTSILAPYGARVLGDYEGAGGRCPPQPGQPGSRGTRRVRVSAARASWTSRRPIRPWVTPAASLIASRAIMAPIIPARAPMTPTAWQVSASGGISGTRQR